MKKLLFQLSLLLVLGITPPASSFGASSPDSLTSSKALTNPLAERVFEIKSMDFSTLSRAERRELKQELRSIEKELRQQEATQTAEGGSTGIYISFGALIIMILLLIIIL